MGNSDAVASDAVAAAENSPSPAKKSAAARILVVDDEALIRWSVAETLSEEGYEVDEAGDGASALRALLPNGHPVDVVLLDLRLPDCDDLHVLSGIRRVSPQTPVILMTAYGSVDLIREAKRLGAFAIVDKPFEMQALPALVEDALAARPQ